MIKRCLDECVVLLEDAVDVTSAFGDVTNFGLELALRELGIALERTPVGDRHVAAALREGGSAVGGEPSGHIIFGDRNGFIGDGLFSALATLEVLVSSGQPFQDLCAGLKPVPQVLTNVKVRSKPPLGELTDVAARTRAAEEELGDSGRVLVRYSGTENLLRVMVEGADADQVDRLAAHISDAVRASIGVDETAGQA